MSDYARLANQIRAQALAASGTNSDPRHATISSYDPNTHAVKVLVQPENVESGWMPMSAIGIGNGFGLAIGPNIGDQVLVVFPHGSFEAGVIVGRYFDAVNQAIPVPSGEIWMIQKSGSYLKFLSNGDVQMLVNGNYTETVTGTAIRTATAHQIVGPVTTDKTIVAGGDITDNAASGNQQTMYGMRHAYDIHYHPIVQVQIGNSTINSQTPLPQV
ncbi:phage baseplate assembly protein V [Robbsia andropogonis]|uniref:phage baseplate assembly protein V n=1 Tax=Robbsia andropogonis TaxID=28092 RepID=UPI003D1B8B6F